MQTGTHEMSKEMKRCVDECLGCYSACVRTAQHCLEQGGKHSEPGHMRLMHDCAEICRTSAAFLLRDSPFHARTCGLCAEICRACERDCRRLADDPMMLACADACRACAESCEKMAKSAM